MKFLLCFALMCAVVSATPAMNETEKSEKSPLLSTKTETVNNRQKELNDLTPPPTLNSSQSNEKEIKTKPNDELDRADEDKPRLKYASTVNNLPSNPSMYTSQLTSIHNTDSSYPVRTVVQNYRSVASIDPSASYGSYGLGSETYGSLGSHGLSSSSYPSSLYGLGSGSYGNLGTYGNSGSYGNLGTYGNSGLYGNSGSYGNSGPYGNSGSYGLSGSPELFDSSLPAGDIPTSYSNSIPCRGGINVAQQIIHKPIITELQEVIHKPIITELQEVVNKPVISEVQQIIHKPLYTEHISLGPSYHGYQKHIMKQPTYQKPTANFVRRPMSNAGIIHLADDYEHATRGGCLPGANGLSGVPYPATYGSEIGDMQQGTQYGSSIMPNVGSYGSEWPVSSGYSHQIYAPSTKIGYSTPTTSYKYTAPASNDYSNPNSFGYASLPSYKYISGSNSGNPFERTIINIGNEDPYRSNVEMPQPKAAEQIMYDELRPYKQQSNDNQQYNLFQQQSSGFQKQWERNSEDSKQIKMDVDAIAKQIEKNPEMRKQLIKIITESLYVGDKIIQADKKQQDKTIQ